MADSPSPKDLASKDESQVLSKKVKNFSAQLTARAKAESGRSGGNITPVAVDHRHHKSDGVFRPSSSASTLRPDSVLSFRSEIPNVKQTDVGAFRPESVSILPPDTVTTIRPDSVAAAQGLGQGVFRPFQPPSGPTARFNIQYQAASESDWEARDEMRQRELEEMRARAAQMEKTMRWWSDCTANWREKWSKVRNERNKMREDCRQLRSKLEVVVKECAGLKREKQDLVTETDKLKAELELQAIRDPDKDSDSMSTGSNVSLKSQPDDFPPTAAGGESDVSQQRVSTSSKLLTAGVLEAKLKELTKLYNAEKEEKESMKCKVDDFRVEVNSLRTEIADVSALNSKLQARLNGLENTESSSDSKTSDTLLEKDNSDSDTRSQHQVEILREQLERLQVENAAEWAKREKLSSEKHSLERENKRLRNLTEELQSELKSKQTGLTSVKDMDIKTLQEELASRNKEYAELRQSHSKQKKQLQEATTELSHTNRRSEQYEQEVRKLRARIEELKDDLITAENEIDTQTNLSRKLQRTCDNLQEVNENYQAQLAHLQSRLRISGITDGLDPLHVTTETAEGEYSSEAED